MKKSLLLAAGLLPLSVFAQQPFTVKGDVKGITSGEKVYLSYNAEGKSITDSTVVTNGIFLFAGKIKDPSRSSLYRKAAVKGQRSDALSFYIEPGNISVATADSLKNAKISGSVVNADNALLKVATKTVQDKIGVVSAEYGKFTDEQKKDKPFVEEFYTRYYAAVAELNPIYLDFARKNPKSYISLTVLSQLASNEKTQAEAEAAYVKLAPKVRQTATGQTVAGIFEAAKKTKIGLPAIEFTQNDVNDKPVKLSDFKGKYVLVDFWASWCGPCRQENPNVVVAYNKFKDKGFTVLGVSLDQPGKKDAWLKAIEDDKLTWTHVSDLKFWDNAVAKLYGIRSIPANYLIDPSGKIVAKDLRDEALQKKLEEIFNEKAK